MITGVPVEADTVSTLKPVWEKTSVALDWFCGSDSVNLPEASVWVPAFNPLTVTLTAGSGLLESSLTVPVRTRVWAFAERKAASTVHKSSIQFFIWQLFKWQFTIPALYAGQVVRSSM